MKKTKATVKKEMEETYSHMELLLKKAEYAMTIAKKYPETPEIVNEADVLMKEWSAVAKKYVTISKEYHNMVYKNVPI